MKWKAERIMELSRNGGFPAPGISDDCDTGHDIDRRSFAISVALDGFALGAVFVQFVAEGADADLEHLGGLGAVAVGRAQRGEDRLFFHFIEWDDRSRHRCSGACCWIFDFRFLIFDSGR